ncbi:hypothetical protein DASB73_010460 [Starmerella bacillaris]|uniref:Uncharacterized protein n=1 Tax=Starmerella bacillaris TaxID=1247836 RepID=A0AAV5RF72_STABA|nr:hypothetical protein DASB73_010460 [Starmerella bacillaris]
MPLYDYVSYSAGFMPKKDAEAQRRCYAYLRKTILELDKAVKENPNEKNLKNIRSLFENIRSMIDTASGSQRVDRAHTFWKYWDKNKRMIISTYEGTNDDYTIQDKMAELEEGRYIPS